MERKVEILVDGNWCETTLPEIKEGMTFRLTEPDGTPVVMHEEGKEPVREFVAACDAYNSDAHGEWVVDV